MKEAGIDRSLGHIKNRWKTPMSTDYKEKSQHNTKGSNNPFYEMSSLGREAEKTLAKQVKQLLKKTTDFFYTSVNYTPPLG